jgi:uncharacterized protein (DUF1499 family)
MGWLSVGRTLAVAGAVLLVAAPLGTRFGVWTFPVGFALLALSALSALIGAMLSTVGGFRTREWRAAALGIVVGTVVLALPASQILRAGGAPPIHDITTDTVDPPAFVAALALRRDAANPSEYDGADVALLQQRAFPDIQPLELAEPPDRAFGRVLAAAEAMGWEVVASAPAEGRLEAVDTTFWFGFRDDIVIRVRAADGASRVDVRSKSRVGLGDAGTNARRVRAYLAALKSGT